MPAPILTTALLMAWAVAEAPGHWLDIPFVRQTGNGCGSACISMVIQYWEREAGRPLERGENEPDIRRTLSSPKERGISASSMESFFRDHGFHVFAFTAEWEDLEQQLSKGRPLIVCLQESKADLHYVVVAGTDRGQGVVMVNDPARRKLLKLGCEDFQKRWRGSGNWTLLAVP